MPGEKQTITKADVATIDAKTLAPVAAQPPGALIPVLPNQYDDQFKEMASAGKFLPRLQLFGANSDAVKEDKIQQGSYGLVTAKDQITPLGKEVNCLVIGWRPKAMSVGGDEILTSFKPTSPVFKDLQARSDEKDSGCMFGPEYLVYLPSQKTYATFFMGSKTSRREAPNVKALLGMAATLKVQLISTPKYKWHGTVTTKCSTPFDLPSHEEIMAQATAFQNPPEETKEPVDAATAGTERAR